MGQDADLPAEIDIPEGARDTIVRLLNDMNISRMDYEVKLALYSRYMEGIMVGLGVVSPERYVFDSAQMKIVLRKDGG